MGSPNSSFPKTVAKLAAEITGVPVLSKILKEEFHAAI
jgi:hypothetical protein